MNKDEMIARAKELGLELTGKETKDELAAMIAEAEDAGEPQTDRVVRRKVNRGSRRRIERMLERFSKDMDAAIAELDMQVFVADEDGNRIGDWPLIDQMRAFKQHVNDEVTHLE